MPSPRPGSSPAPPRPGSASPRLTLALGGGGARCFAHVGVLDALAEAGVVPAAASASSTAAFVAGLWAAGWPPEGVFRILLEGVPAMVRDVELRQGLLGHEGIERALAPYLPERFEELEHPLAVVAIDTVLGERAVFDSGPLLPALLASNAFPALFTPVELGGRVLVDGGGIEMVPVPSARERWPEPVLAVDVSPPRSGDLVLDGSGMPKPLERIVDAMMRSVSLVWKSYTVTQSELVRHQLRERPPRWRLRPELADDLGLFGFDRADEAREAGRRAARAFLPRLLEADGGEGAEPEAEMESP